MASNLFDDEELKLFIDRTFYQVINKFDFDSEKIIFSKYFITVMGHLDDRESKKLAKKNVDSIRRYKKNLLDLTAKCVFETYLNYSLGAGQSVLLPIYEQYRISLVQKNNKN